MMHSTEISTLAAAKDIARAPYAWPGGYPKYLVTADGAALCANCTKSEFAQIARESFDRSNCGFRAAGSAINWEDSELHCEHCGKPIESAYGETQETESSQ